jgi:hypothetical protein
MRPLSCRHCGFESRWRHVCLSLVFVMYCQEEVSTSGWSLVHRSATECRVSECDCEVSNMGRSWPTRGCHAMKKKWTHLFLFIIVVSYACFIYTDGLLVVVVSLLLVMPGSVDHLATSQPWKGKLTFWEWGNQKLNQTSTLFMSVPVTSCLQQIFQISCTTSLTRETHF